MNTRRSIAIILLFIMGAILAWLLAHKRVMSQTEAVEPVTERKASNQSQTSTTSLDQNKTQLVVHTPAAAAETGTDEALRNYVANKLADPGYDWKQPINFYGKVVDENEQPVSRVSAYFKWTDLSIKGTSEYQTFSDASGLFSMLGERGKRLSVTVSKEGYYSARDARLASFEYANPADGKFTPDPNHPVIFHLRKKGPGVDLLTSEYGVKKYFGVSVPLDGTPVTVDLLQRKLSPDQGQLIISQKKPSYENWKQATEWSFRMEIPGGGFVGYDDEFPFVAPESGFEPTVQFDFKLGQPDWATSIQTNYFVKFGSPPRYGWLHLETQIMMEGARLTYAINPDGSRYLEPK